MNMQEQDKEIGSYSNIEGEIVQDFDVSTLGLTDEQINQAQTVSKAVIDNFKTLSGRQFTRYQIGQVSQGEEKYMADFRGRAREGENFINVIRLNNAGKPLDFVFALYFK